MSISTPFNDIEDLSWTALDKQAFDKYLIYSKENDLSQIKDIIFVNGQTQRLHLLKDKRFSCTYEISTAKNGFGAEENTGKTPLGWHQVSEKIGDLINSYGIFDSREFTGALAVKDKEPIFITTRILRLKGLEEGKNLGKNSEGKVVDSFDRYIYIHGTNDEKNIGEPVSAGCVRMRPEEMIALFDQVEVGALVYIYA